MKCLGLIGALALGASAHAVVIDDFLTGNYNSGAITSGTLDVWTSASSALGGNRYQSLTVTGNPLGGNASCRVIASAGVLDVSSDTDVDINYTLGYGYAASSTTPASNQLNTSFVASPRFELEFRSNDITLPVTMTLYTNGGANTYSRSMSVNAGITTASPVIYTFDFTSDAASLGDVDGIKIFFDPAASGDFALNGIYAVPEPTSIAAISLGAIVLLRRRKSNRS